MKLKWAEEGTAGMAAIANLHAEILKVSINQDSTPEENKDGLKALSDQCDAFQPSMTSLETLSAQLEAELIFENEHCPLTIEQVRGNLNSLSVKIQSVDASLTNQILTRDATNITEEQMEEFKASFNHFDKDKSGYLDQLEFRGCLLSLGMDIPQIAAEGDDAKYEEIWSRVSTQVDSNAEDDNGQASFNDFVAFMAAERADAGTKDDLLEQFEILSGGEPYITAAQLNELPQDLVQYCVDTMAPYEGGPDGALDYVSFAAAAFGEATSL